MKQPWYADGLRFTCTECGKCCSGEPGYVWVTAAEIAAMSDYLQLSAEEFRRRFVRRVDGRWSLIEHSNGDCVFLDSDSNKCTVYPVRPVQCRTWPFWSSNLRTPQTWEETCRECPGAGQGKLYSLEQIQTARKQKRV